MMANFQITDFGGVANVLNQNRRFMYREEDGRLCLYGVTADHAKIILAALAVGGVQAMVSQPQAAPAPQAAPPPPPPPLPAVAEQPKPRRARKEEPLPEPQLPPPTVNPDPAGLAPPGTDPDKEPIQQSLPQPVAAAPKPAVPAPVAKAPTAAPSNVDIPALASKSKLRDILSALLKSGYDSPEKLIAVCEQIKDQVPVLGRIAEISERVPRTLEVMGWPSNMED